MIQEHPIAPPSEDHVLRWSDEWFEAKVKHMTREKHLCMQAARWGADQELEACCEWLEQNCGRRDLPAALRDARRPEPPSLKGKALDELQFSFSRGYLKKEAAETIRRALESLPE